MSNLNKFRKKRDGGYFDGQVATQRFFHDCEGALIQRLGLLVAALVVVEFRQVVETDGG